MAAAVYISSMRHVGVTMKWMMVVGLALGLTSCTKLAPGVMESCQATADCAQGLVCLGNRCGECRQDSECPGVAKCGLVQAGRCGCFDADGDGASCDDCDDADPARFPSAAEVCDGKDNDCDGTVDEGAITTWYVDADGDGYGNSGLSLDRCQAPANFVSRGGDCNDADPTTFPGRTEVCDARDNNCDGTIDEGVKSTFYRDADGDGFGDPRNAATTCQIPASGFVAVMGDCDDSRADANPQAMETCNNRDDDCDGVVDGLSRACNNMCGDGTEVCTRGIWAGCTAPPVVTISSNTTLSGSMASYDCLVVSGSARLVVPSGMTLQTRNWFRMEGQSVLDLGARVTLQAAGDMTFAERSTLLMTDASFRAGGTITLGQDAKWYAQSPQASPYSGGGSPACAPQSTEQAVGGAGGGARGGSGGQGSTCNILMTQVRAGAGGPDAMPGANGCGCDCTATAAGGPVSGGAGGGMLAGGGGGANGGSGGSGGGGRTATLTADGGQGGLAEGMAGVVPLHGGGAGGSSGSLQVALTFEACQGGGGNGGGVGRVTAARFVNQGLLSADGSNGETPVGGSSLAGGGGAGAGGSWVFATSSFENRGAVSAVGGRGGAAVSSVSSGRFSGGGGGGGGGRIHIESADGGSANIVFLGNLYVGGGLGGSGMGGAGQPGAAGIVFTR